ncbi:MAG: hypothetical protein M3P44_00510 [Actinomycetota bacterium]|nr:hypothetical protein [Actinomycetota bacterium]
MPMNIAVVHTDNNLTAFVRMDGAWLGRRRRLLQRTDCRLLGRPAADRGRRQPFERRRAHLPAPATVAPLGPGNETPAITGSPTLAGRA